MTTVLVACPLLIRVGGCEQWGEGEEGDGVAVSSSADGGDQVDKDFRVQVQLRQQNAQALAQLQGQSCYYENLEI